MEIPLYLAKTAAEFTLTEQQPKHLAWMACHYSPYGTGLTNLPASLPENTLVILNDRTPVHGHDPKRIKDTIEQIVDQQKCSAVLLDFQRRDQGETEIIVQDLLALPCPVFVSDIYAKELDCPVFLPPVPLTMTLEEHLTPWKKREILLEVALENALYTVTESGLTTFVHHKEGAFPFRDEILQCHYRVELSDNSVNFYLFRNEEDIDLLLDSAASFGVTAAIGLWQELRTFKRKNRLA